MTTPNETHLLQILNSNIRWSEIGHRYEWVIEGAHGDTQESLETALQRYGFPAPPALTGGDAEFVDRFVRNESLPLEDRIRLKTYVAGIERRIAALRAIISEGTP